MDYTLNFMHQSQPTEILTNGNVVLLSGIFVKVPPDILNTERVNSMGYMFSKVLRYTAFPHYLFASCSTITAAHCRWDDDRSFN